MPPSSGGGVVDGLVQVPCSEPGGTTHSNPVQQSEVVVQTPDSLTHMEPHLRWPASSGQHGAPLQQSPEVAHAAPGITQAPPSGPPPSALQRGMPTLSSWQQSLPEVQ